MQYESRIPVMIDNWYSVPMRPRIEGGETSATYIGERIDAPPTASPPAKRARMKSVKLGAMPVATDVTAKNSATHSRILRRPYESVNRPAAREPRTHPNSSELKAQPRLRSLRWKCSVRNGPA